MPAVIPEPLRVFIPSAQSHSPLCSFAAGINPSQIFRLCVNKHFLTASKTFESAGNVYFAPADFLSTFAFNKH